MPEDLSLAMSAAPMPVISKSAKMGVTKVLELVDVFEALSIREMEKGDTSSEVVIVCCVVGGDDDGVIVAW
jgi:hypothetical protein